MMTQKILIGTLVSTLLVTVGCSSLWKKDAITVASTHSIDEKKDSLVVLLPGFGGKGVHFEEKGFLDSMREYGLDADIMTLNIKPRIYFHGKFVEFFRNDIILPAKAKGYRTIYLVGISMGGHGVLLYATRYPNDIEALFVLSPFISGSLQSNAIVKAGGIEAWEDCPFLGWGHACRLWKALKEYASDPERKSNLFLGYGQDDVFAKQCRILSDLLPPENVFTAEGEHDWPTWKKLWIMAMARFRELKAERLKHLEAHEPE